MVTRVNARLLDARMRVLLHRHSFLGVIRGNVLENFLLGEWLSRLGVAGEPEPGSLRVEIVGYAQIVFAHLLYHRHPSSFLGFFGHGGARLGEHVVVVRVHVVEVEDRLFSLLITTDDLHFVVVVAVEVEGSFVVSSRLGLGIRSFNPAVFNISLELSCIFFVELLQVLDSLIAGHSLGDEVLLVCRQVLIGKVWLSGLPPVYR